MMTYCINCTKKFPEEKNIGTKHRNHCPYCLHSLHLDDTRAGDRKSNCHGIMKPIALTFKNEGLDKYGKKKQGEIMIVHKCEKCGKISINRIAGDDSAEEILKILNKKDSLTADIPKDISILTKNDENEVKRQLLGD